MKKHLGGLIPALISILLFAGAVFWFIIPTIERVIMNQKQQQARLLTDLAVNILAQGRADAAAGRLSLEEAQTAARERVRVLRYGENDNDYFWIITGQPKMVMHPYRPELEGWDLSGYVDPNGKSLFVEMVKTVEADGAGFVSYLWQWRNDPNRVAHKLSYVRLFEPWDWIVGTGVYLDDVEMEVIGITSSLTGMSLAVLAAVMALYSLIIIRDLRTQRHTEQTEKALLQTTEIYRAVLEAVTDPIIVYDDEGNTEFVNRAFTRVFGWTPEQVLGQRIDFVPPDCMDRTMEAIRQVYADPGGYTSFESRRRTADGRTKDIRVTAATYRDGEGRPIGTVVNLRDITARKRAEEALDKYQRLLETVVNELPFWISVKDNTGSYLMVNRNMARDRGLDPEDHVGLTNIQISQLYPDGNPGMTRRDKRVMETGRRLVVDQYPIRIDDQTRWRRLVKVPWQDEEGLALGVISWSEDITERKISGDELRKYQQVVDASADLVALVDFDLVFQMVNRAYLEAFDKNYDDVLGKKVEDVIDQEFFKHRLKPMVKQVLRGETVRFSVWINLPKAGRRCLDTAYYPYRDHDGAISGYVLIARDVTEQRVLEQKLLQSHKMEAIGTLAGGIAHDFNNILAAIIGYSELAADDLPAIHPARDSLERITKAGNRARSLVSQILSFSRKKRMETRPVDLGLVIGEALELIRSTLPSTIEISADVQPGLGMVMADPGQIHQVVMNLATNAAQAMPRGGRMDLELTRREIDRFRMAAQPGVEPGSYLQLTVTDTGPGMDTGTTERIFEPFFTTKEPGQGTGMGLAVVHGIVENHGGKLLVDSRPGLGSTFTLLLPAADEIRTGDQPLEDQPAAAGGSEEILFVDDEESLRDLGLRSLSKQGYSVTTAASGRQALELFRRDPGFFDIIVTDETMPEMTGLELVREVMETRPLMPIILCSGFTSQVLREKARAAGVRRLAAKPVPGGELARLIREVLDLDKA